MGLRWLEVVFKMDRSLDKVEGSVDKVDGSLDKVKVAKKLI